MQLQTHVRHAVQQTVRTSSCRLSSSIVPFGLTAACLSPCNCLGDCHAAIALHPLCAGD
jgi:hypothetical protein